MDHEDKVRENRLRRMAERRGFLLKKSRRRDPGALGFGGFMLVNAETNAVVLGGHPFEYSADLDDIEAFLTEPPLSSRNGGQPGVRLRGGADLAAKPWTGPKFTVPQIQTKKK